MKGLFIYLLVVKLKFKFLFVGGAMIVLSWELFFQIFNTMLYILIPIAIYSAIKKHKENKALMNDRISNLEKKINDLENR